MWFNPVQILHIFVKKFFCQPNHPANSFYNKRDGLYETKNQYIYIITVPSVINKVQPYQILSSTIEHNNRTIHRFWFQRTISELFRSVSVNFIWIDKLDEKHQVTWHSFQQVHTFLPSRKWKSLSAANESILNILFNFSTKSYSFSHQSEIARSLKIKFWINIETQFQLSKSAIQIFVHSLPVQLTKQFRKSNIILHSINPRASQIIHSSKSKEKLIQSIQFIRQQKVMKLCP